MNILYIHQYFKTPEEPGGTRSYWIAKKLQEEGHQVYMLTTSSSITKKIIKKNIEGINVIYLKIPYDNKMGIISRMISFIQFMIRSTIYALRLKSIDMVIATSTPLTIGFPALVLKKIRRIPFLFEVRDLWPEVPIQMGGLKNRLLIRFAYWFEKTIYKNASYIVALSPGMKDGIVSKSIATEKVFMIPNMAKIEEFYPRAKNFELMKDLGLQTDSLKVIHFGTLGIANGVQAIIEAAKLLKNSNIEFLFIGGGAMEDTLKKECLESELDNVKFLGKFPMKSTSEIVNLCDVSMVSFLDLPILYTNSPNKLFDSLSAGKPIIVNSAGWTKVLVEKYACGYYVSPNEPQDLAEKLLYLNSNPDIAREMGFNSRKLAETKYDKSLLCQDFCNVVKLFQID